MRLSHADHERITELAGRGFKSGRIAQILGYKKGTIAWFMYSRGLKVPIAGRPPARHYSRNGVIVCQYSAEEDAFIQALRIQGYKHPKIAELATKRFGVRRTRGSVSNRLLMLAAIDGDLP